MRVTVFTGSFFSEDDLQYRDARVPAAFRKVVAVVTDDGRKVTHLDFSHLLEFDGFSQHESVTGVEMVEQLDDPALIRV